MSKYGYLRETLIVRGLLRRGSFFSPAPATQAMIELAHEPGYVDRMFRLSLGPEEIRRIGLPCNGAVLRRTRLSSAGTTLAGWLALEHGLACNAAGGSHHAAPGHGAGFCVFNDVAVAIENLRAQGAASRFLIVDADVHQGDGTAAFFQDDVNVVTFSIHAEKNFPARKMRSDLDIALGDGTTDDAYLRAFREGLDQALKISNPEMVFFNAGVDVHREDRLGRLGLTDLGIHGRDSLVIETVRARGLPLVCVLGGGYSDDLLALANRHAILFEEAARVFAG